ncbi:MAG TPA: enoyl-CoA hydratase-related protein [Syntrophales bacterium]|nr:enoyl-CoA hydratase-related protein [Syntrophales bacterium]HQB30930.1 enoyl-CoA hydratase-related protein [Syntrophales bacterium]HQN79325.1 enoyl-CoA hydratase-related protein [Syntrophales bacterium]HQQ28557.1 enoyl-CoA hydratase-related protein [Syntrophales bacterium]
MEYKNLLFEVKDSVALVQFNRPKALNAMNSETMGELIDAVKRCGEDESIKVVVLTGAGDRAFVAGADIVEMQNLTPAEALKFMERGHETYRAIEILPKPVIAAIKGFALGGGTEISMSCDMRFAADNARFGQPEILLGLIPGWGGTQRLTRLIGIGRAKEFIMGGEQISAQRAYELGLVNRIYPADQLMEETMKFAKKLAGMPGFAIKMAKHAINFGYELPLDPANRLEMECCAQCFSTQDQKEGMKAFVEKRKANFIGK